MGKFTVLLVEGDQSLREIEASLVKHLGHDHLTAENAREALKALEEYAHDLAEVVALINLELPGISGLELSREIASRFPQVKRIGLSRTPIAEAEAEKGHFHCIAQKPYGTERMQRVIHAHTS